MLLVFCGIIGFCMKKNEGFVLQNDLISEDKYDFEYNIDENFIHLVIFNKLEEKINVEKILLKENNVVVGKYNFSYTLNPGENQLNIPNDKHIAATSLAIELYNKGDSLEEVSYSCSIEKESNDKWIETYFYHFSYLNHSLNNCEVYREYKFKSKQEYDQFIFDIEVDSDFSEHILMDEENLTQKYIFNTTYPISPDVTSLDDYIKYLETTYGYSCHKRGS